MRHLPLLLGLFTLANPCWAGINAANGIYLGADLIAAGYGPVTGAAFHDSFLPLTYTYRPFLGYRMNNYLAVEAGYTDLVNHSYAGGDNYYWGTSGPDHYRLYAYDLAGKVIYPFNIGLSLYAKLGAGYVHQSVYNLVLWTDDQPLVDTTTNRVMPLASLGISINFTQRLAMDFSFTHLQGISPIGNIEMLALGLSYTFGFGHESSEINPKQPFSSR